MFRPRANPPRDAVVVVTLGFAVAIGLALLVPAPVERASSGAMTHEVYVWQRRWDETTRTAVRDRADAFGRVVVLAVEIEWEAGQPRIVRVPVDWDALKTTGRPVGAALRIGPFPGPFTRSGPVAQRIAGVAASIVADTRAAGVTLSELQIDFDAASSKLDGYRIWVQNIAGAVDGTPVVITALPAWLGRAGFDGLIDACNSYILQVHSLEAPNGPRDASPLCDPDRAVAWVERAARYGRPFRVALPTYGYLMAFDLGGKFVGLSAEGPRVDWPRDGVVRRLDADPAAMARLVERWKGDRPMHMEGVIWYRLPTEADAQNWAWPTLASVMAGVEPTARMLAQTRRVEPALVEIDLANEGSADGPASVTITADWRDAQLIAADGLHGYAVVRTGDRSIEIAPTASAAGLRLQRLAPSARRTVAWLRFDRDTEVHVDVQIQH